MTAASVRPRTWTMIPAELSAAAPEALLTAIEILTHRVHEATTTTRANADASWAVQTERDLRAQRDLVRGEILRRMGGAR
jgi:hypothetical protein